MDLSDGFLWVVGSHSAVRKRVTDTTPLNDIPERLTHVTHPQARRLLARIPLSFPGGDGPQPVRCVTSAEGLAVWAAAVPAGGHGHSPGPLLEALRRDEHVARFVRLPGKDNGLDIEGIAVVGRRVLLGLRGPVLRGWAVVLEIEPRPRADDPRSLELAPLRSSGRSRTVAKHFLDLRGLGVRDLARDGDDLLVLAGPTMALDGPSRVLRIRGAGSGPMPPVIRAGDLEPVGPDLPVGDGENHPEAMTVVHDGGERRLLVLNDSPSAEQVEGRELHAELVPLN
jgi:hypothetical protein